MFLVTRTLREWGDRISQCMQMGRTVFVTSAVALLLAVALTCPAVQSVSNARRPRRPGAARPDRTEAEAPQDAPLAEIADSETCNSEHLNIDPNLVTWLQRAALIVRYVNHCSILAQMNLSLDCDKFKSVCASTHIFHHGDPTIVQHFQHPCDRSIFHAFSIGMLIPHSFSAG